MDESSAVEASSLEEEVTDELMEEAHYETEEETVPQTVPSTNKCCIRIAGSVKGISSRSPFLEVGIISPFHIFSNIFRLGLWIFKALCFDLCPLVNHSPSIDIRVQP